MAPTASGRAMATATDMPAKPANQNSLIFPPTPRRRALRKPPPIPATLTQPTGRADKSFNHVQKIVQLDRLRDIAVTPADQSLAFIADHRESGDGDDWNVPRFLMVFQLAHGVQSGDVGQLKVHQDQVRPVLAGERQCRRPLSGG